jgi:Sugar-specific transcriptional regulator TrmB
MAGDAARAAQHVARWSDEDQIISGLAEFGLGRNEARLYVAAVGRPSMRAAQLAARADISRTKAYDALRLLVDKGLFTEEPGRVARFRATDARTVAMLLRKQTFTEKASLVEDTRRLVADLFERYYATAATADPFESVHVLRHEEAAWARQETMIAGARGEVLRTRRRPLGGTLHMDELSLRPGVSYRAIYEGEMLADPAFRAWVAERGVRGERYRFVERVTAPLCVVDRAAILLSLNPKDRRAGGTGNWLTLQHAGLGSLLAEVFERQWRDASLPSVAYGPTQ